MTQIAGNRPTLVLGGTGRPSTWGPVSQDLEAAYVYVPDLVTYTCIPPGDFAAGLAADGVPRYIVDFLADLFATVLDGRNTEVADGVERVLGRPARDFADYAPAIATTGVRIPGSLR